MESLSVVIPVYNSEESLAELHERLIIVLGKASESHEVIFVNDSSTDSSWNVIEQLAKSHSNVTAIQFRRNFGQHNALLCGIRAASGEVIITIDDDLQHPPEELPQLLSKLEEGYDVVYGSPISEPHNFFRGLASRITKRVLKHAMGAETARQVSALRVFRTSLRTAFENFSGPSVNLDVMLTWATTRFVAVKVQHNPRLTGQSGYTIRKLIQHSFNMMTGFSTLPLQIASIVGFAFSIFGIAILAYVLVIYLIVGAVVPGFAFLASIVALFSGAQLLALGIIGEYLARIHFRTLEKPTYVVEQVISKESNEQQL